MPPGGLNGIPRPNAVLWQDYSSDWPEEYLRDRIRIRDFLVSSFGRTDNLEFSFWQFVRIPVYIGRC
jgi:hypothetical protein